jgi:hypothetical protein
MATADEYRQYAKECLQWADEAKTDDERRSFLDMARDWTLAAMRLEGMVLGRSERPSAATPER